METPVPPLKSANKYIYDQKPFLIYWEITRSCDLACRHCRAEAMPHRDPRELTYEEGLKILHDIKAFGNPSPHLVITGGDPLKHPDVFHLIKAALDLEVGVSFSPSATPLLDQGALYKLKALGVQTISLSLDGATPETHDAIRGVKGCFDMTMDAIEYAHNTSMPVQINTLVCENTIDDLIPIYEMLKNMDIVRWSIFFLISVGRGSKLVELSPKHAEEVMEWVFSVAPNAPFAIKTTEAPHYRRVAIQKTKFKKGQVFRPSELAVKGGYGIRDANGIMFISHIGDVYPSGFLPVKAGNVRKSSIIDIYRTSAVFTSVRDPKNLEGKCGYCEFRYICGGSRARAYFKTGKATGSDPLCPYEPKKPAEAETAPIL
jgi:radical SAM protein